MESDLSEITTLSVDCLDFYLFNERCQVQQQWAGYEDGKKWFADSGFVNVANIQGLGLSLDPKAQKCTFDKINVDLCNDTFLEIISLIDHLSPESADHLLSALSFLSPDAMVEPEHPSNSKMQNVTPEKKLEEAK